jgi:hypothetical protein
MESKYFCEICGTKPDQLSHHRAHLQTQKHAEKCEIFKKDMRIFSMVFRQVDYRKWHETEYKDYIIAKYIEETKNDFYTNEVIKNWIFSVVMNAGNGRYDWTVEAFNGNLPQTCYECEFNCELKKTIDITNTHFNNWAIDRILKTKETVQSKPNRITSNKTNVSDKHSLHKIESQNRMMLSRHTNIKFIRIKDIRNGIVDLDYLFKPREHINFDKYDSDIYDDSALRYSCLLFHRYGIHSYNLLYAGGAACIDNEECPEEKKYNCFYFWKDVEIEHSSKINNVSGYGETRIEKRKIWTSCYMGDVIDHCEYLYRKDEWTDEVPVINYSYISNDDFKYFIKESLIEMFTDRVKYNERQIEEITKEKFRPSWLKHFEKIVCNMFTGERYIIKNSEMTIWDKEKNMYFMDQSLINEHDDMKQPMNLKHKLTEEQCKEMEIFTDNREKKLEELEKEAKYYSSEALKIKDLNISSELFKSIFHICQYLFEYDEDLIEYYKTHTYVSTMNFQKERMLKHALEEAEEM